MTKGAKYVIIFINLEAGAIMENKRYIVRTLTAKLEIFESEIFENLQNAIDYQNSIISESFFTPLHGVGQEVVRVWIEYPPTDY